MSYWQSTAPTDHRFSASPGKRWFSALGRKLILNILIVNALLSMIASGVQLYASYNRDRANIDQAISVIEDGFSVGFADALWEYNFPLAEALLEGVYNKRDVEYVVLTSTGGRIWTLGTPTPNPELETTLDFSYRGEQGREMQVGTLRVGMTLDYINARLMSQFWVLLLSNFTKTVFASLIMLALFQNRVSRHLTRIAQHVLSTAWQTRGDLIVLDRKPDHVPDDLDHIVTAINSAKERAQVDFAALQSEVKQRRAAETKLRLKSEALEHTNREQAEFTYAISHDLKSPANTLAMLLADLEREEAGKFSPDGQELLDDANHTIRRMTLLVEDVLGYARTVSDGITFEDVDLGQITNDVITDLKADIVEADANIILRPLPHFEGHPVQLRMLMQNLISNALKFRAPERSAEIVIEGTFQGEEVVLTVSDNGIGIPSPYRERVFGLFQRLHSHGSYPGSGLGLSLCYRIAVNHNGQILIREKSDAGTTFEVRLPRVQNDLSN